MIAIPPVEVVPWWQQGCFREWKPAKSCWQSYRSGTRRVDQGITYRTISKGFREGQEPLSRDRMENSMARGIRPCNRGTAANTGRGLILNLLQRSFSLFTFHRTLLGPGLIGNNRVDRGRRELVTSIAIKTTFDLAQRVSCIIVGRLSAVVILLTKIRGSGCAVHRVSYRPVKNIRTRCKCK